MAQGDQSSALKKWVYLEGTPPLLLVLIVLPLSLLAGPYSGHHALKLIAHTFASGEIAAVSVCMLLPISSIAFRSDLDPKYGRRVMGGLWVAIGFYCLTKFAPAPLEPTEWINGEHKVRVVAYSAVSLVVAAYAFVSAYVAKEILE